MRFQDAVECKGFWNHFDGTETQPTASATPTPDKVKAIDKWDKEERAAKSLLTQKLPDGTLMRVHRHATVKLRWDAIVTEFTEKGAYAQADLQQQFVDMKCPPKGDVREFLDGLCTKREELSQVGVSITDNDYRSTILASLPQSLASFVSATLSSARLFAATKTVEPDTLIMLLKEEAEREKSVRTRKAGKEKEEKDEALSVVPKGGKGGKSSGKGKKNITCWNCGEKGHYKDKCPKPEKTTNKKKDDGGLVLS